MKTLSVYQPFASLIAIKAKTQETRSWHPSRLWPSWQGRPLAIHASKGGFSASDLKQVCASEPFKSTLRTHGIYGPAQLPRGAIVATCILADARRTDSLKPAELERSFGDYTHGRWGWILEDIQPMEPILFKGGQGFFNVPDELLSIRAVAAVREPNLFAEAK